MKSKSAVGLFDARDVAAAYATALVSIAAVLLILCLAVYAITAVHVRLPPGSRMPNQQPDTPSASPVHPM